MGLFDMFSDSQPTQQPTGGFTGFLNTPMGTGLLSAVASYAANARRGTPVNNIGRGLMGGIQGYQDFNNNLDAQAYKKALADSAMANSMTARLKTQIEQQKLLAKQAQDDKTKKDAANYMKTMFGMDAAPDNFGVDENNNVFLNPGATFKGGFTNISDNPDNPLMPTPVENQPIVAPQTPNQGIIGAMEQPKPQGMPNSPILPNQPKLQIATPEQNQTLRLKNIQQRLGLNDGDFQVFMQMKPEDQYATILQSFNRRNVAKQMAPKISQEMNDVFYSMGIDPSNATLEQRKQAYEIAQKNKLSRVPSTTVYGTSFTSAVDAQGNPVLLQPSKSGGQPNKVEGYMPADEAAKVRTEKTGAASRMATMDNLDADIADLMNDPGLKYAVGAYSVAPAIPGTSQANAIAKIENLGSRSAVLAINDMRAMSKSGGAVGQVSEKEWPKLEAQYANLNRSQTYEQYVANLKKFQNQVRQSKQLIEDAMAREPQISRSSQPPVQTKAKSSYQEYLDAYNRATTPDQKKAITERARQMGVVK